MHELILVPPTTRDMRKFKADGHTWDVYLTEKEAHAGVGAVVFRCATDPGRGWRVVEVPAGSLGEAGVDGLSADRIEELYGRSQPFDYAHDPKAHEDNIGHDAGGTGARGLAERGGAGGGPAGGRPGEASPRGRFRTPGS